MQVLFADFCTSKKIGFNLWMIKIKILEIRIYYFVIHSLLFGMKFCKVGHIQAQEQGLIQNDQNLHPNYPQPAPIKTSLEPISQEELYRSEIERFMLIHNTTTNRQPLNYFNFQTDLSEHMRGVLLNWLIEVHQKYKLMGETYFLMVRLIDMYLSVQKISRGKLQLVGITALWIAAKYIQTYQVPKIPNLVYICDNAYKQEDILAMEGRILVATGFEVLSSSSALTYFELIQHHACLNEKDYWLARYLLESSTFDIQIQKYQPSVLAYSLCFFIKKLRGYTYHGQQHLKYLCGVTDTEIRIITRQLCALWQRGQHLQCLNGLRNKYSHSQFYEVSKIRLAERPNK